MAHQAVGLGGRVLACGQDLGLRIDVGPVVGAGARSRPVGLVAAAGRRRIPVPGTGSGGAARKGERVVGLGPALARRGQRGIEGAGVERRRSAIRGGGQ